jgi:hypothetical protein
MMERLGQAETTTNILGELNAVAWNSFPRTAVYTVGSRLIGPTAGSVASSADTYAQCGASICCLNIDLAVPESATNNQKGFIPCEPHTFTKSAAQRSSRRKSNFGFAAIRSPVVRRPECGHQRKHVSVFVLGSIAVCPRRPNYVRL